MIHDLSILARARESQIRQQVQARQVHPRYVRRRRGVTAALVRRAACRLGSWLVVIGRRLECYDFRVLGETEYVTG